MMVQGGDAAMNSGPFPAPQPERIVIYLDTSADIEYAELNLNDREKINSFERLQKVVRMYAMNKEISSCGGRNFCQFALMVYMGDSPTLMDGGTFGDAKYIADLLDQVGMRRRDDGGNGKTEPQSTPPLDIGEVISTVAREIYIHYPFTITVAGAEGHPEIYLTRLLLFVTHSRSPVILEVAPDLTKVLDNPLFTVDIAYLHEAPSYENIVEANWSVLRDLNEHHQDRGYILDCGPDVTDWHHTAAVLLPSPALRVGFNELPRKKEKAKTVRTVPCIPEVMEIDDDPVTGAGETM